MGRLREYTGNANPPAASRQREEIKAQLDGVLQQFDVVASPFDRLLFKYICVYMLSLLVLAQVLLILSLLSSNTHLGEVLVRGVGMGVPPTAAALVALWRFNVWRVRLRHTLGELLEQKCLALPEGDAARSYLCFLEHYRAALASPKRYVLSAFLMLFIGSALISNVVQKLPNALFVVYYLLYLALFLGGFYCLGILIWATSISGCYVRNLVHAFPLSIRPFHPDQCGGLKLLGNVCFGFGSPLVVAAGLLIGYSLFALVGHATLLYDVSDLVLNVYTPLLFVLLVLLPAIVLVFILPLRAIHRKMVSEAKTNEQPVDHTGAGINCSLVISLLVQSVQPPSNALVRHCGSPCVASASMMNNS